ncbi:hypothetical protein A606_00150 [Corynebacterium terpenotabidum Y-11]|uniref:Uncharacterized protein n=1 Tax=Corynebacterium terpenotabidum Y-11 TaxID=1200352 RepID=S4XGA3_9CORY|nr:hypothetical protein A606_00150 [Corynebacterium terpenotabidum Y-11]
MTEFNYINTEDASRGAQKRETLGSIPCGFRERGGRREYADLDVFTVTDEVRGTAYSYLCVADTEIRVTAKSAAILSALLG